MVTFQVKVFYGETYERCKTIRFDKRCLELINFQELGHSLMNNAGTYLEKTLNLIRIQYKNNEGTFESMTNDKDLIINRCLEMFKFCH